MERNYINTKKFGKIPYETLEEKVKWFRPLSFTRKYEIFASFMQFYRDIKKDKYPLKKQGKMQKTEWNTATTEILVC